MGDGGGGLNAGERGELLLDQVKRSIAGNGDAKGEYMPARKPGSVWRMLMKVRISKPVLVSRTKASATSAETRALVQDRTRTSRLAPRFFKVAGEIDTGGRKTQGRGQREC